MSEEDYVSMCQYESLVNERDDLKKRLEVARELLVESKQYLGTIVGWSDRRDAFLADFKEKH